MLISKKLSANLIKSWLRLNEILKKTAKAYEAYPLILAKSFIEKSPIML